MAVKKLVLGFLAMALSALSGATIQLHAPFAIGQSWKASTYANHAGNPGGTWFCVDFNKAGTSGDGDSGQPVCATHDGVATFMTGTGYGNYVEIVGLDGHLKTRIAHLLDAASGSRRVKAGEQIGRCGKSGGQQFTHVHMEVFWKGAPVSIANMTLDGQWLTPFSGPFGNYKEYFGSTIMSKPGEWDWHTLPGQTWQAIATSDTQGLLYFMHTGMSSTNGIYYAAMNGSGVPPSAWTQLPGATALGLAMTHLGATRYIAHRSLTNDHKIYFGALNGTSFGGWSWTGETSSHAPALCEVNGEIYLLHKGDNEDQRMLLHAWKAGQGWRAHEVLPGLTAHAPALAKFKGQLWAAHRGVNANGAIFVANRGGDQIWRHMGGNSPIPPSMFEWEGRLFLAHRGNSNNYIYLWSTSGAANDWRLEWYDTAATVATPGLFAFYGRLYITRVMPGGGMAFKRIG